MDRARSLLFVPGHREHMIDKALALPGLDVALLDLEDGVPLEEKPNARRLVAAALARPRAGALRAVRVSAVGSEELERDLQAVVAHAPDAILLSKVQRPDEVVIVASRARGIRLIAAIESARGLLAAPAIAAASPQLGGLMFGAEDYANDLGLSVSLEGEAREMRFPRAAVVVAAAAAGVAAFDGVWPDIADLEGLRRDALLARQLGFRGKSLIHPSHVAVANEVFAPTESEIAWARKVVAAAEAAARDRRAAVAVDGRLVDPPILERARRVLRGLAP